MILTQSLTFLSASLAPKGKTFPYFSMKLLTGACTEAPLTCGCTSFWSKGSWRCPCGSVLRQPWPSVCRHCNVKKANVAHASVSCSAFNQKLPAFVLKLTRRIGSEALLGMRPTTKSSPVGSNPVSFKNMITVKGQTPKSFETIRICTGHVPKHITAARGIHG